MVFNLNFFLLAGCTSACCNSVGSYTAPLSSPIKMDWAVDCGSQMLTVTLTGQTGGWLGFGLSQDEFMPNSDIVMGYVDDSMCFFYFLINVVWY